MKQPLQSLISLSSGQNVSINSGFLCSSAAFFFSARLTAFTVESMYLLTERAVNGFPNIVVNTKCSSPFTGSHLSPSIIFILACSALCFFSLFAISGNSGMILLLSFVLSEPLSVNRAEKKKAAEEHRKPELMETFCPHSMRHTFATRALERVTG